MLGDSERAEKQTKVRNQSNKKRDVLTNHYSVFPQTSNSWPHFQSDLQYYFIADSKSIWITGLSLQRSNTSISSSPSWRFIPDSIAKRAMALEGFYTEGY